MYIDLAALLQRVVGDVYWVGYLARALEPSSRLNLHLAVVSQPFLDYILDGRKTIESRFSRNRCAPFCMVAPGDIILFKQVGGPVCGLSVASRVWYYDLTRMPIENIRQQFDDRICADEDFWGAHRHSSYASLVSLSQTIRIEPVRCNKRDRRGWVLLRSRQLELPI